MYKLTKNGVQRLSDGAFIPDDVGNVDWREYLNWAARGGVVHQEFSEEELKAKAKTSISQAIQLMLNKKAQTLGYDSIMSARSYAGYTNVFQAEAQSLAVWCSDCWAKAGELDALGVDSVDEVLAQMPIYGA